MEMIQAEFRTPGASKVVWVDASWNLQVGNAVSFKNDGRKWEVVAVYTTRLPAETLDKKWGLDLPKAQRTEA